LAPLAASDRPCSPRPLGLLAARSAPLVAPLGLLAARMTGGRLTLWR
jgi:hypothetical protein